MQRHSPTEQDKDLLPQPGFLAGQRAVNLPSQIDNGRYQGLNGFDTRCCVYGSAIAVLTEQKFPDSDNNPVNEKPESDQLRRG
ncbi:hypothetical protein [Buttiauxella sp. 3AFRM03]|uniref:hypothetical protein n=1 Tax=Buttiauxella sp. 3AFRM03 TaxID=2479367 RepID=UPI001EE3BAFC|nr:hypothetical protein [Buttiauxella sp. 3AFRM03]